MRAYKHKPRLTITELRAIIEYYHARFPSWRVIQRDTLVREDGPVAQGIVFERLLGGGYRPTAHVRILVAPEDYWTLELSQRLNIQLRNIDRRRDTPEFRERVIEAMRTEFVPSVDQPLNAQEVSTLYEQKAVPTSTEAYSLAPLNAFLGNDSRALNWCSRFTELVNSSGNPWQDFDYERRHFLDQLEKWLQAGDAKQQLERVLQEQRRKWGLA